MPGAGGTALARRPSWAARKDAAAPARGQIPPPPRQAAEAIGRGRADVAAQEQAESGLRVAELSGLLSKQPASPGEADRQRIDLSREILVGVAGFEPATPSSRTRCSTRLSHTPINWWPAYSQRGAGAQQHPADKTWKFDAAMSRGGAAIVGSGPRLLREAETRTRRQRRIGASPSGKAAVFGTAIPRFESWRPSQFWFVPSHLAFCQ